MLFNLFSVILVLNVVNSDLT